MKCHVCGKPLNRAALTIPSKAGPLTIGPKCAKRYERQKVSKERAYRDPATMDLFEAAP